MLSTQNFEISSIWGLWQDTLAGDSGWMLWLEVSGWSPWFYHAALVPAAGWKGGGTAPAVVPAVLTWEILGTMSRPPEPLQMNLFGE